MVVRLFSGMLLGLCLVISVAQADIFSFTDDSGTPHFSDVPNDERFQLYSRAEQFNTSADLAIKKPTAFSKNREKFNEEIKRAASVYQLDEALLHAVISVESGYNSRIVSKKGAVGLMQLMPGTAKRYKIKNSFDPAQNIQGGAQYLSSLLAQFDNNVQLALAAYNAGENNVRKYGGHIPPFPETVAYVPKVMGLYAGYRQEFR
jgi:soluble lytic murein transglycosylase-like protein